MPRETPEIVEVSRKVRLGIVSDTHGLLRPGLFELFSDVDAILHAGDIGDESILDDLATLAPVYAVVGNTDGFPLLETVPETRLLQFGSTTIFMTHIGGEPEEVLIRHSGAKSAQAVIFGHSHRPLQDRHDGTLFFNPGSAGPRRFNLPVTAGLVEIDGEKLESRILDIPGVGPFR